MCVCLLPAVWLIRGLDGLSGFLFRHTPRTIHLLPEVLEREKAPTILRTAETGQRMTSAKEEPVNPKIHGLFVLFHFAFKTREQNVVFQMNVLEQIRFQPLKHVKGQCICPARPFRQFVPIGNLSFS